MLNFELSIEEANLIISALSKQSFETVAPLIAKLQSQAQPQLQPKESIPAKPTKKS